jgi:hypothetical protein
MSGKQPPIDAIARWIARKPEIGSSVSSNIGYNAAGQRRTTGTLSAVSQESRVRSLAFLIARAIGKRGYSSKTPPLRVFENAYQQSRSQVEATMLRALKWRAE